MRRVVAKAAREALRAQLGEVTGALLKRWHGGEFCLALTIAESFIKAKNEGLIPYDRRTDRGAKLVLLQWLLRLRKIIVGIHRVVAKEFPQRPMDLVRARPRDEVGC